MWINAILIKRISNVTNENDGNIGVLKDRIDTRDSFKYYHVLDTDQESAYIPTREQ